MMSIVLTFDLSGYNYTLRTKLLKIDYMLSG